MPFAQLADIKGRDNIKDVPAAAGECQCPKDPLGVGRSFPLGATVTGGGANFSVFSRQASRIELLLFDDAAAVHPARVIELDPRTHRTYHYWHAFVPGIGRGSFMPIAPAALSIPGAVCVSILLSCSSIPMVAASWFPTDTLVTRRADTVKSTRTR